MNTVKKDKNQFTIMMTPLSEFLDKIASEELPGF